MRRFDYMVIPAPVRAERTKGKTAAERYALAMADEINRLAAEGWDYVRAETLPSEERSGLTGRSTVYHNLLVFRRPVIAEGASITAAARLPQPEFPVAASPMPAPQPVPDLPAAAAPRPSDHPQAAGIVAAEPDAATPPPPREPFQPGN